MKILLGQQSLLGLDLQERHHNASLSALGTSNALVILVPPEVPNPAHNHNVAQEQEQDGNSSVERTKNQVLLLDGIRFVPLVWSNQVARGQC